VSFPGFPARPRATAIPNVFFSDVLPSLGSDPVTLGVVLYAFNLLQSRRGFPRYLQAAELASEPALASYIAATGAVETDIDAALARAVDAGILLPLTLESEGREVTLFFLNAPADRRGLEAVRSGSVPVGRVVPVVPAPQRSSVFALYESVVGTLSPLIADELTEAERLYPPEWLERAFREAAAQNARSWRYVSRILERWAIEGADHEKVDRDPNAGDRYFAGKYGRILKQRYQP
jgi:DnaD/phage-associated family protein